MYIPFIVVIEGFVLNLKHSLFFVHDKYNMTEGLQTIFETSPLCWQLAFE